MKLNGCIMSNIIYLLSGIYLIFNKLYVFGLIAILVWFVSHSYHNDYSKKHWKLLDRYLALFVIIILFYKYHRQITFNQICILFFICISFILARYLYYKDNIIGYDISHSIWHIGTGLLITYIIYKNEIEKLN
jgi:hypothetical protein